MGMLTHVNTFNDLSEVPLAATWGKRYALGERDEVFRYGNPYRCESVSDHFGKFAKIDNPEVRRSTGRSRSAGPTGPTRRRRPSQVKEQSQGVAPRAVRGQLLIHGEEWIDGESWPQYKVFLEAAGKEFLFGRRATRMSMGAPRRPRSSGTPGTSTRSRS